MPQASEAVLLAGGCAADDCGCCGAVELDVDFRAVADSVFDGNSKLKQLSNGVCPLDLILCHCVAAKSLPFVFRGVSVHRTSNGTSCALRRSNSALGELLSSSYPSHGTTCIRVITMVANELNLF